MQPIALASHLPSGFDPGTCTLHCAVYNGESYPIDVLANDPAEWQRWNSWRGDKNYFNRQFVFSLAQDRHDPTLWLFGGTWDVIGRRLEPRAHAHVLERESYWKGSPSRTLTRPQQELAGSVLCLSRRCVMSTAYWLTVVAP